MISGLGLKQEECFGSLKELHLRLGPHEVAFGYKCILGTSSSCTGSEELLSGWARANSVGHWCVTTGTLCCFESVLSECPLITVLHLLPAGQGELMWETRVSVFQGMRK